MGATAEDIAEVLGGRRALGHSVRTMRELDAIVRQGMPKAALDYFLSNMVTRHQGKDFSSQLRYRIVPRATYQRVERFNLQVGETTERLARLFAIALSVFEDPEAVRQFLLSPHPELDDRAPFDVALTEIGGREVEEVIERGLHGLPA